MPLRRRDPNKLTQAYISTDGLRDYVEVDGLKYIIAGIPMMRLVADLAGNLREGRLALDAYLAGQRAPLRVDKDALLKMLAPAPRRWTAGAVVTSLIQLEDQTPHTSTRKATMADNDSEMKAAIAQQVANIEQQISLLNNHAKDAESGSLSASMMKDETEKLRDLISWLKRPSPYGNQSQNSTFYGLPGGTPGGAKTASFDNYKANTKTAEEALAKVALTHSKVEALVAAGKRFNAAKAKADLHKVASRVSEIVASVDLGYGWVGGELTELHKRASDLDALYPAKV